jgi:hypothetical protein
MGQSGTTRGVDDRDRAYWTTKAGVDTPKLFYDPDTMRSIVCRANQLKN